MTRSRISIRRSHTIVAALVGILGASLGHGASLSPSAGAATATTKAAAKAGGSATCRTRRRPASEASCRR